MQTEWELDTVCSLLRDECRRRTLRIVADSGTTTKTELARRVARCDEASRSVEAISISLHHVHLPRLADENAIRYDADAETIALTEEGEELLQFLSGVGRGPTA